MGRQIWSGWARRALVLALVVLGLGLIATEAGSEQAGSEQLSFYHGLLDAGNEFNCAVLDDGNVRCFGRNDYGQLGYGNSPEHVGDGETPDTVGPVKLGDGRSAKAIAGGFFHTCAQLDDRSVRCWGYGGTGALGYGNRDDIGDNETPDVAGPVRLGGPVRQIAAQDHSCAILTTGALRCWGGNFSGQLGYGNTTTIGDNETPDTAGPVSLGEGRTATAVTAGRGHTCVILDDGSVRCWGSGTMGRLGGGNESNIGDNEKPDTVPVVNLGRDRRATAIAAGGFHTCAVLDDGSVRCWGWNDQGQLGYGNTTTIGDNETPETVGPVNLGSGRTAKAITAGEFHSCALLDDDTVRCWGLASSGQLGYGNTTNIGDNETPDRAGPVVLGEGRFARSITAGYLHTCAALDNGSVRCFGENRLGELGYGNTTNIGDNEAPATAGPVKLGGPLWSSVADLSLTASATPASVPAGTNTTITVTLRNAGPSTATGVSARLVVPAGFQFVSAAPSQGSYSAASGAWTVGTVATTATPTLQVVARATTVGSHIATAEVTASGPGDPDSTPANGVVGEDDQASVALTVPDTTPPDTTIDSGPSGPTLDSTPTFSFSSSEPAGATFACRTYSGSPSGTFAACSSPHTTAALADGPHTFEVRATDAAGNTDPTPAQRAFIVDTAAPNATINSGPSGPTNDSTPTFSQSSSEPEPETGGLSCRVYSGAPSGGFASCNSTHTVGPLADGSYTFEVRATDAAGNTDPTPAQRAFVVDTGAPAQPTLTDTDPDSPANDNQPEVKGAAEVGSTVRLYTTPACLEPPAATGSAAAFATPGLTASVADDSATAFYAKATDVAGNASGCSFGSVAYVEDSAPPQTAVDSGPSGPTADSTPTFSFSSTEPAGATFACRTYSGAPSGAFAPCSSPHTTAALPEGPRTFEVRAADAAGNVDPMPAQRAFSVTRTPEQTIDVTSPETEIEPGPAGTTRDKRSSFGFSSKEPGATFECSLDGVPFAPCSSPFTTPTLRPGGHVFQVRARDVAGNADPTPATFAFVVKAELADLPPPMLGKTFNLEPVSGVVLVSESPASAGSARARASVTVPGVKGRNFVPLREARQIAVGALIDTRRGRVSLLSARDRDGRTQPGEFLAGVFQVLQSGKSSAGGRTELRLKGSSFGGCATAGHGARARAAGHSRRIRRLRGSAKGRFVTRGRYSAATVRGTVWEVTDRCDGTLTSVTRGKVAVRDFRRRRTVLVKAGKRYLARAPSR